MIDLAGWTLLLEVKMSYDNWQSYNVINISITNIDNDEFLLIYIKLLLLYTNMKLLITKCRLISCYGLSLMNEMDELALGSFSS